MPMPCNVVGCVIKVTLRRSRLVLSMGDRVRGYLCRLWYVISHPGQLSLLPSAGWQMSTVKSAVTPYGWGVKAGMTIMAHSTVD